MCCGTRIGRASAIFRPYICDSVCEALLFFFFFYSAQQGARGPRSTTSGWRGRGGCRGTLLFWAQKRGAGGAAGGPPPPPPPFRVPKRGAANAAADLELSFEAQAAWPFGSCVSCTPPELVGHFPAWCSKTERVKQGSKSAATATETRQRQRQRLPSCPAGNNPFSSTPSALCFCGSCVCPPGPRTSTPASGGASGESTAR
jgi:hypothetical protein